MFVGISHLEGSWHHEEGPHHIFPIWTTFPPHVIENFFTTDFTLHMFCVNIHFEDEWKRRQNDGSMEVESRINMRLMILPYCHLLHLLLLRKISHHCITWAVLSNAMEMKTDIFFRPATNFLVRLFNRRIFHQLAFVYFKPRQCQWFLFLFAATRDSLLA